MNDMIHKEDQDSRYKIERQKYVIKKKKEIDMQK